MFEPVVDIGSLGVGLLLAPFDTTVTLSGLPSSPPKVCKYVDGGKSGIFGGFLDIAAASRCPRDSGCSLTSVFCFLVVLFPDVLLIDDAPSPDLVRRRKLKDGRRDGCR